MRNFLFAFVGATIATVASLGSGLGDTPFPERNLNMIIPYASGGGFDIYARAVATAMEKQLPSNIRIIPRNVPGAAAINGLTTLYRAPADGYTLGIVPLPGGVLPHLVGQKVAYDLDRITWLGLVNVSVYTLVVSRQSPFNSINDLVKSHPRTPFIATTGTSDHAMAQIVMKALGGSPKYLNTFRSAPEALLAVLRGEADAAMAIGETVARFIESGEMKQLIWFQERAAGSLVPQGVPTPDEIGHPDLANIGLYRMFAAPPGVESPVLSKLRGSLQASFKDPEFLAWSTKSGYPVSPGSAEEAMRLYEKQKNFLSNHVEILKNAGAN